MKNTCLILIVLQLWFAPWSLGQEVSLSPANWEQGELERNLELLQQMPTPNPLLKGTKGAITGTYSAPAMRAGFEALRHGGSAVDAALTSANAQIVFCAGGWVSYTGILTMVYYDAETGTVHNLNAGYNTVLGEDDPMSIPGNANLMNDIWGGTPSGRSALVQGSQEVWQVAVSMFVRASNLFC